MRTNLREGLLPPADESEARAILRACVHCGFCNATCPSYQVLGDERDGPRGRIYLIKSLLEGSAATGTTQVHLDRCLDCRACETTCPSGVQYTRLHDLVRPQIEKLATRGFRARITRWLLRILVPHPRRFRLLLAVGRFFRPVLPGSLRRMIPRRFPSPVVSAPLPGPRRYALLEGCVQEIAAPEINQAAVAVFARLGITLDRVSGAGCCGALALHLGAVDDAMNCARRNIDAWWPAIEAGGCEGVVSASSGCSQALKAYDHLLRADPNYATRAAAIAHVARDASELMPADMDYLCREDPVSVTLAFQTPCSLQHGLRAATHVESALVAAGYSLVPSAESHLCCGSAGAYSLLQPAIAEQLLRRKLECLQANNPEAIVTANIGCLLHLRKSATIPVRHWLGFVADRMRVDH
ncbi:MAG: glycolate oxidase subunit GlcF [Gammaproteobacteria bacterium]